MLPFDDYILLQVLNSVSNPSWIIECWHWVLVLLVKLLQKWLLPHSSRSRATVNTQNKVLNCFRLYRVMLHLSISVTSCICQSVLDCVFDGEKQAGSLVPKNWEPAAITEEIWEPEAQKWELMSETQKSGSQKCFLVPNSIKFGNRKKTLFDLVSYYFSSQVPKFPIKIEEIKKEGYTYIY